MALSPKNYYQNFDAGACNFIKKETLAQVFFCEFCEISKNNVLQNTSGWLPLYLPVHRILQIVTFPVDIGHKLNVHKTFRRRPERSFYVLCLRGRDALKVQI